MFVLEVVAATFVFEVKESMVVLGVVGGIRTDMAFVLEVAMRKR